MKRMALGVVALALSAGALATEPDVGTGSGGTVIGVKVGARAAAGANAQSEGGEGGSVGDINIKGGRGVGVGLAAAVSPRNCDTSVLGGLIKWESVTCEEEVHVQTLIRLGEMEAAVQYACGDPKMREALVATGTKCKVKLRRDPPVRFATGAVDAEGDQYPGWRY